MNEASFELGLDPEIEAILHKAIERKDIDKEEALKLMDVNLTLMKCMP